MAGHIVSSTVLADYVQLSRIMASLLFLSQLPVSSSHHLFVCLPADAQYCRGFKGLQKFHSSDPVSPSKGDLRALFMSSYSSTSRIIANSHLIRYFCFLVIHLTCIIVLIVPMG